MLFNILLLLYTIHRPKSSLTEVCLRNLNLDLICQNGDIVATIYSPDTVEEAFQGAIHRVADFLTGIAKIPLNDAGMLVSVTGALKSCQVVASMWRMRLEDPRRGPACASIDCLS